MSTPKTPMERYEIARHKQEGSMWFSQKAIKDGCDWREHIAKHFYLAGDADRERLMREEASRDRANLIARCKDELAAKDRRIAFLEKEATRLFEPTKEFWNQENLKEARADRAELIACVLEIYGFMNNHQHYGNQFDEKHALINKHSKLFAKLKAEVAK